MSNSQSVKSLNKSPGRKRFVFKNFSQRVEEIEIDVYRSLDALKSEPAEGSSFFRESLLSWRELNTAEDFISFYEELMPWVQTLPQILLHKETIISKLLCRLRMQAKLSLEPILRLIATLSRDLLEEFLPFLQRITDSIVHLLKDGGERDPEVLEQVFTAWSYMMMHLQKYLTHDVAHVLKITVGLRYYPKDYVQEFMAEAFSFLLRKAPVDQLIKGVRKVISEVVKKPLPARKSGASALLWHSMRGTSTRFHSRANEILRLLMDKYIMHFGDKVYEGSATIIEVISGALKRICQELPAEELNLVLVNLYEQISVCIKTRDSMHLGCLISLLIFTVRYNNGSKISEYKPILELVELLMQTFIAVSTSKEENYSGDVLDKTLQLMLCLLDVPKIFHDALLISSISQKWAPVFMLRNSCLLSFIKELILKDPSVPYSFRGLILSAMNNLVEESPEQVLYLMLKLFERLQGKLQHFNGVNSDGGYEEIFLGIFSFFQETISQWIRTINALANDGTQSNLPVGWSNLAILWGVLTCYPQIFGSQADSELMLILVEAVNQLLLAFKSRCIDGLEETAWHGLVGAALVSYHKLLLHKKAGLSEIGYFLNQARRYKSSQHVLFAVADFLDSIFQSTGELESFVHPELDIGKSADAIHIFAENLALSNKDIRVSTLRILCHYEHLDHELSSSDYHGQKRTKLDGCQSNLADSECSNVIQLLHLIEVTPLSIFTSRKVVFLISRIERGLSAARISAAYIDALFYGVIGICHNRFAHLWDPAVKCLTLLIEKHAGLVWDRYVQYLEKCHLEFFASRNQVETSDPECQYVSSDLVESFKSFLTPEFDSTPCSTILTLLLRSLQNGKVPSVVESRSQQLIPLFFKFLGYSGDDIVSVGTFNWHACKGKSWREVLKEWLNLLKLMRNPRSLFRAQALQEVLVKRLLDDSDPDVQLKVLDCLLTWKDDFLLPYELNIKNLITSKNLREELTTWTLSREADHVHEEHRGYLIPIVIQILIPKVRKLKALASRKHAGVHHRRAVLSFLAQLDLNELPSFFSALLKPLEPIAYGSEGFHNRLWISSESSVDEFQVSNFWRNFTVENINDLSWKKRSGFLHVIQDILGIFDGSRIRPFLNLLMGFVVRILESCTVGVDRAKIDEPSLIRNQSAGEANAPETVGLADNQITVETVGLADNQITKVNALKQFKDLRSLCLKIISFVLSKHDCHELGTCFWDIFFMSVKPLIYSFKQEGSSSEKPSSLFSCFLSMSSSPTHVKLLDREENLVPIIFSILTVKTASDAIITSVLSFVENLLNLDNDSEFNEDCGIKRVLLPHIDALIHSVHGLFICRKGTHRKSVTWPGKTELRILKLLSKYIKESSAAQYFVDIMLPFLAKKGLTTDECIEGLHVMKGILPILGPETTGKILIAVYPLLISAGLDIRLSICNILDALAVNDTSMGFLAKLVRNLNAVSVEEMGEFDYDARVNAYEEITPDLFSKVGEDSTLVILSHCVYDMSSEELILRQSASKSLLSFVQFSGTILDCKANNHPTMVSHDDICDIVGHGAEGIWTKPRVLHVLRKFYMRHVGEAMTKEITVQKEWITLLRDMVLSLPQVPALNAFRPLCSEDEELDFFYNILHLQKYRRAKALSRFRNFISAGNLPGELTMKVFIPLFFNMLFEVKDGKGEHVRDACLESLASISGVMQWSAYHSFLLRCFRELTLKPDKQKLLLRLICSIIDKFHFTDSQDHKDRSSSMALTCGMPTIVPLEIQSALQKSVFPEVHKLLTSDSERVNVHVSLAALKLLKLLPVDTMESQLPSIIHRISNFLKSRLESIRDEARSALAACFKELGPAYLHFIVNILKSTLKRGYELHVLGYTLNFILSKTLADCIPGKLDYCLEVLLSVAENDILGDVAEEKEVEKIASKMKETKKSKSFDTLKVIAQSITFKTHAFKLLSSIKPHMEKHLTQKAKTKVEAMLHHIALGIECNPSADPADLFVFVYGLIEDGIGEAKSQNSHLVTVFGLRVLNNRLKNMKLDKRDELLLSMLDPLVGHLGHCLKSKYEDIVSMALNCLALLVRLPLPSLKDKAKEIKDFLLDFAQRPGSASSPLMQSCLKLLTILLQSDKIVLAPNQLRDLIQFLFSEMESNSSVALSLLKAIVGRRLVVNEIYDLVKHVAELMVTSQSEPTQKKCSQILLQFLLDYPLHEKRLQQHLDFLLENLSYVHPSGREAVLEMVHAVLKKFPKEVLNVHAENFFLKLVVCLANENNNKIQSMVGAAIKLLIENISQQAVHRTIDASFMWYTNEKQKSWSIGAQALGLLVEALKKRFKSHISEILPVAQRILTSAAHAVADKELKFSDEAKIPLWRESYYTLAMLEKIFIQFQDVYFQKDLEIIWELICKFLLHPHMWLRNISSRLVAMYFAETSKASRLDRENLNIETFLLMEPSRLFSIAVSFCSQLKTQLTEEVTAKLITQNLVFAICGVHSFSRLRKEMTLHEFWSTLCQSERDRFLEAFEALGSIRGKDMFVLSVAGDQCCQDKNESLPLLLVGPILKKMAKVALGMEDIQMKVVFGCFRTISSQIGYESCCDYAMHLLQPLYKVCEGFAGKVISDEVKQLAAAVRDSIQRVLGTETFVQIYNLIRRNLKDKRDRRKQELKRMPVINPMRHAKRKLRVAEKHKAHKRRKIMKMKERK